MAVSLADLKRVKSVLPPRVLIYGPPKLGKTTLANEFPDAVFLQTETGENSTDEITTFGEMGSYNDVISGIAALYTEDHTFKTLVLDSADKFEPMLWAGVCEQNNWNEGIETPGYGKGYLAADGYWRDFISGCNALRRDRGMSIVYIAHSEIGRFDDPRTTSYSRYDIRLHKRAIGILCDEVDVILCLNQEASIKEEKQGFNKVRAHAEGGVQRWMYLEGRPSMNAGNRYNMPPKMPYMRGKGYEALAKYFPHANGGVAPAEPEPVSETVEAKPVATKKAAAKAA